MDFSKIRVRYAPSPTGEPHVGNIRTALFDWLIARNSSGQFIVRVEDTDQARKVEGTIELQKASLKWLGLDWDEGLGLDGKYGPYTQSERLTLYTDVAERLLQNGKAYKCICNADRLSKLRKKQLENKVALVGYDGNCRSKKLDESDLSDSFVVRFKMPDVGISEMDDLVRGHLEFDNSLSDDFIILKSDGYPTYHLASVVDDHYMDITHVLRGEEWVSSVPRHIQLYLALGWEMPLFAHLPTILAPDKSKLSKRHGATSVLEYKKAGYLPEAMFNFLSLLGWSLDGDTEIISKEDLVSKFDPSRISSASAIFDIEKLNWMNGHYIRSMSSLELSQILGSYWKEFPPEIFDRNPSSGEVDKISILVQERIKVLSEASALVAFIFKNEITYDPNELIQKQMNADSTAQILDRVDKLVSKIDTFSSSAIEVELRALADSMDVKVGTLLGTIRVATSGQKVSPPLFDSLEVLGRNRVLELLHVAKSKLA
ncbi:MAG: glutamyl-tRNA synthetase [Chloroflexi bacterium]|nr:MAG: glutamyl-tRNA synthetase [Chloroflexota bacterium]